MSILKIKDRVTGAWIPAGTIYGCGGEAVQQVSDETGSEMTQLWTEFGRLQNAVQDWPVLKERNSWKGSIPAAQVTEVRFVREYEAIGTEDETWNADVDGEGTITGYRSGTVVTICSNGAERIRLDTANALNLFANMQALEAVKGLEMIDASGVENLAGAFYNCKSMKEIDLSAWHLERLVNANGMFNGCTALQSVKFSRYGIPAVESCTSMFDGCIALTEVDMGRGLPIVGEKMFFKCLELVTVSGLDTVSAIGDRAFVYTPKLAAADLRDRNVTTIGESACRLSGIEDSVALTSAPDVGEMATRSQRWSSDALTEIRSRSIPDVYIQVPNAENQDNYADIQFGTYNGEPVSVAEAGCSALALYHEWNAIHAGTDLEYASFREWWNATIGATDYVSGNTMDGTTVSKMVEILGWTSLGLTFVEGVDQLDTVIQRLEQGLPTFASMQSANNQDGTHAVLIIGGDSRRRKLAVLDSHVVGTDAIVSWIGFEDIFSETRADKDYIEPFSYGEG